ncbi:MAG TPA: hypothetical protein VLJ62_01625 [Burkholderiaceae bacterium]|nr:hypothetical protein [Burkholderiaceae bacterium]
MLERFQRAGDVDRLELLGQCREVARDGRHFGHVGAADTRCLDPGSERELDHEPSGDEAFRSWGSEREQMPAMEHTKMPMHH